jgi:hypothetical protein
MSAAPQQPDILEPLDCLAYTERTHHAPPTVDVSPEATVDGPLAAPVRDASVCRRP